METSDIFTSITKYHKSENQFTASLVYLLRYLWDNSKGEQRRKLCCFLSRFCGVPFTIDQNVIYTIQKAETEDETEDEDKNNGRTIIPDFQIDSGNALVWVEVKDEASLKKNQLDKYRKKLMGIKDYEQKKLVLLRHHFISEKYTGDAGNDVTWDTLYEWLKEVKDENAFDEKSIHLYLLSQFLKYLQEKGAIVVETINGESLKTGLSHLVSLLRLVVAEATKMFQENELQLNVSKTDIGYSDTDFIEFNFDEKNKKGQGYFVGLWGTEEGYPFGSVILHAKSEDLEKIEEKRIIEENVPKNNKDFFSDEEKVVYVRRPLESVFAKDKVQDQRQEIGRLLREMYDELEQVKENIPKRRGKS